MKSKEMIKEKKGNKERSNSVCAANEQDSIDNKETKEQKSKKETSKDVKELRDLKSIRAKFQLRKAFMEMSLWLGNGDPIYDKNHGLKFEGDGVTFKAKLIGIEKVDDARGDKMCQESLQRLKAAIKSTGEHKQKILLGISLEGIKITDEKSGETMYQHPVHKISFISQDVGDARAFGYIFGAPHNGHQFFAIKTEKAASHVVIALRDLFQAVLQMKKQELEKVKQQQENVDASTTEEKSQVVRSNTCETAMGDENAVYQEEPVYTDIISLSEEDTANSSKLPYSSVSSGSREMNTIDSLLDFEVDCLQQGIAQMDSSIAAAAAINSSFDMELPFPPLSTPLLSNMQEEYTSTSCQQDISTSELAVGASPSQSITSISDSKDTPNSDNENLSDSITNECDTKASGPVNVEDRYAVFSDLDSLPSIFENPHIVDIPVTHANDMEKIEDDLEQKLNDEEKITDPLPPISKSPNLSDTSIFADLDPLGKNRPYVDKKDFFQELKKPPKKVLKDLAGDDLDNELFYLEFLQSPRSSISDSSVGLVSVCSSVSNPFRSEIDCPSPPPPQLPPKQPSIPNADVDHNQVFHDKLSWEVENSPSRSPFNPFTSSYTTDISPSTTPPSVPPPPPPTTPPPPPPRLPARGSEPLFQTVPSPPPRPPNRNCATPTPPLPRRKLQSQYNKLKSYASVEDTWNGKNSYVPNGDTHAPPIPIPARKPPLPYRSGSPLLGNNSPITIRRHLTRSPASIDTDSPITFSHQKNAWSNDVHPFPPPKSSPPNSQRILHSKPNTNPLCSLSSSPSKVKNPFESQKHVDATNGASSSTLSQLPSPPIPSRLPPRSPQTVVISSKQSHSSESSILFIKKTDQCEEKSEQISVKQKKTDQCEEECTSCSNGLESSSKETNQSSEPNIFHRKHDPFDDEFFTSLPKKSSPNKDCFETVNINDVHDANCNSIKG